MGSGASPIFHEWVGQELIDEANNKLLGYANSVPNEVLLTYLNEGKDAIWAILKEAQQKHLTTFSQNTDTTQLNYFPPIVPNQREYQLPADFREIEFVECLTPGYEFVRFIFKKQQDPEFANARRAATADKGNPNMTDFYYDILGNRTITFAQYATQSLSVVLWYARAIADIDPDEPIDGVIMPYPRMIATYAVKRATLALQDLPLFDRWKEEWKEQVLSASATAGDRQQADPEFVTDFQGED